MGTHLLVVKDIKWWVAYLERCKEQIIIYSSKKDILQCLKQIVILVFLRASHTTWANWCSWGKSFNILLARLGGSHWACEAVEQWPSKFRCMGPLSPLWPLLPQDTWPSETHPSEITERHFFLFALVTGGQKSRPCDMLNLLFHLRWLELL